LVLAIAVLAGANLAAIQALSAVSGYLSGESHWAKGRKAAMLHLLRYTITEDPAEWKGFEAAVAVPLNFRAARLALQQPQPDRAAARKGLLAAGSHPKDIGPMLELFVHLHDVEPMSSAIAVWTEGDAAIQQLLLTAAALRAAVASGGSPAERAALLKDLQTSDQRLSTLEFRFADVMGHALRLTQRTIGFLTVALALLLILGGAWITRRAFARAAAVERALHDGNVRWSLAAQAAKVEMFEWDLASDRLVWHRHGVSDETTMAAHLAAQQPAEREHMRAQLEEARRSGGVYAVERVDGVAADGAPRWISVRGSFVRNDEGRPTRMLGILSDISDRKRAQLALEQTDQRFRALVESAPDAVLVLDDKGCIQFANQAVERIFGWTVEELVGNDISVLQPAPLRQAHRDGLGRYLRSGQRRLDWRATEAQGLRRDGSVFYIELAFGHVQIDGRDQFAGFLRDISERKAAEAARSDLQAQLRQAQKMESLGQLAGGVAHDFNNIVGAILGNVVLARGDLPARHPAQASVDQISRAALRARELVGQILAFSRRQPVQLVVQPLQPIVEGILQLLRPTLPAGVELRTELHSTPLHANVDRSQIEQVLMNLCTNAWHAARDVAPVIVISVQPHNAQEADAGPQGDWACISVTDNGQGMDAATRERIFEPFFTTKAVGQGTGLGLSLVHGIVTAHQGLIKVESEPDVGSRFSVYLPLATAEAEQPPSPIDVLPTRAAGSGHRVLYVDDDELMRLMMERLLERDGFRVTVVTTAKAAMQALAQGGTDLLLTDFNMPGTTGLQLAAEAMQAYPGLPVVLVSGDISENLSHEARELGVAALVQKEHCFDQLPMVLAQVLAQRGAPAQATHSTTPMIYHEAQRLAALRGLEVLDTEAEPVFDAIARMACDVCAAPMALLSLVDEDRQWFKAGVGLDGLAGTPRAVALCAHTIVADDVLVVPDARADARFVDNPLVTGPPFIRLYAGAPLVMAGGERVGTLSVLDAEPRQLSEQQRRQLQALAGIASAALVLRRDLLRQARAPVALLG
jgi:PAS domain S-box-containing protein